MSPSFCYTHAYPLINNSIKKLNISNVSFNDRENLINPLLKEAYDVDTRKYCCPFFRDADWFFAWLTSYRESNQ